jgi:hypothetical protein
MTTTKVNLANTVEGILPVANGGTGTSTGAAPGGSTTQVQYNNAGSFAGSANLVWDNSNVRLGIGTASPSTELHVKASSGYAELRLEGASGSSGSLEFYNAATNLGDFYIDTSNNMIFRNPSERMRIDSSGDLLIGTTDGNFTNGIGIKIANSVSARLKLCDSDFGVGAADGFELTAAGVDSYIYNLENGFMAFGTNSAERMRILSGGNVGIGTNNPLYALQIADGGTNVSLGGAPTSNGTGRLKFINSNSTINWQISTNDSVGGAFEFTPSTANGGSTFTTPAMLITSAGNVGIGTSSPGVKLEVSGIMAARRNAGGYILQFLNSSSDSSLSGFIYDNNQDNIELTAFDASYSLTFKTNNIERMRIAPNGALGFAGANYGSSGQVLTSGGSGTTPSWTTLSGGVTSVSAGTGISLSGSTGAVTITNSSPNQLTTTTGSPAYYGARAWVNFDGTNQSIRGSVNVSSITNNGTGDKTVNFTTAMPDTNYTVVASSSGNSGDGVANVVEINRHFGTATDPTTSAVRIFITASGNNVYRNTPFVYVAVFR